ncbi:GT2D2 protein, partial [Polyodon spathula]|nr:GT2D2 protein [Polyodon spathula]
MQTGIFRCAVQALLKKYKEMGNVEDRKPSGRLRKLQQMKFYEFLPSTFSQLRIQAVRVMSMFGSTYFCKLLFSLVKINKSAQRSRLNDKHLHSVLKIASAQNMNPDIDKLVSRKRCQISSVSENAQGSN